MSFTSDIDDFVGVIETNSDKVFRGSALSLFTRIIRRTPVLTGRLVSNWQIEFDKQSAKKASGSRSSKAGAQSTSIKKTADKMADATTRNTVYFTNNLPYAKVIEDGASTVKSPEGMVKVSLLEFKRHVAKEARKVNKG